MIALQYHPRDPREAFTRVALALILLCGLVFAITASGQDIHAYRRSLGPVMTEAAQDAAAKCTVVVGGCSGVCVSSEGHILTAGHCRHRDIETVLWPDGKQVVAHKVYDNGDPEGCVVLECDGDGYPFLKMSEACPPKGEKVTSYGYPARGPDASRTRIESARGELLGGYWLEYPENSGKLVKVNITTNLNSAPGWSGGPLLNAKGEVIGVLHGRDTDSRVNAFVSWGACFAAYTAAVQDSGFVASIGEHCVYCERFLHDAESYDPSSHRGVFNRIPFTTRMVRNEPVPYFTYHGKTLEGYAGKNALSEWLNGIPQPTPAAPNRSAVSREPVCENGVCYPAGAYPEAEQRLFPRLFPRSNPTPVDGDSLQPSDLENIRIVVCLNSGLSLGSLVSSGVSLTEDTIQQIAAEHDIHVIPHILSRSVDPEGYDAFAETLGITGKVSIVALIPERKSMSGIVRGQIVGAIERIIKRKLDNLPLKVRFQRTDEADYKAAMDALLAYSPKAPVEASTDVSVTEGTVVGGASGYAGYRLGNVLVWLFNLLAGFARKKE